MIRDTEWDWDLTELGHNGTVQGHSAEPTSVSITECVPVLRLVPVPSRVSVLNPARGGLELTHKTGVLDGRHWADSDWTA